LPPSSAKVHLLPLYTYVFRV